MPQSAPRCRIGTIQRLVVLVVALCRPAVLSSDLLQRGLELHDQGRAAEALQLYAAALEATPDAVSILAPQAAALEEVGRIDAAQAAAAAISAPNRWQLEVAFALGWQRRGRVEEAIAAYRRAASLLDSVRDGAAGDLVRATVPKSATQQVQMNLGLALRTQGRLEESILSLEDAARLSEPGSTTAGEVHFHLGVSRKRLGRTAEAAAAFRSCLATVPNHAEAGHLLAALDASVGPISDSTPSQASEGYVRAVFDAAADGYDEHLEEKLNYRGPELLRRAVSSVMATGMQPGSQPQALGLALDLGCGTGLCGRWMRPLATQLVGIDLSKRMVEQAEVKQLYDTLIVGDIMDELHQIAGAGDMELRPASLIIAADVFVYLGSLLHVLTAAAKVLQPAGLLAFTVEDCATGTSADVATNASGASLSDGAVFGTPSGSTRRTSEQQRYPCTRLDQRSGLPVPSFCTAPGVDGRQQMRCAQVGFVLQSSGRFAHSRDHVLDTAEAAGLMIRLEEAVSARKEGGRDVPGRLYVFTRSG